MRGYSGLAPYDDFDPVVGGAWTDPSGRVHPMLGLMHLRQLIKRTAVMLWQETKDLVSANKTYGSRSEPRQLLIRGYVASVDGFGAPQLPRQRVVELK